MAAQVTKRSTVTLTIKNVPADLARRVRARAEANRRSLQRELLLLLEESSAHPVSLPRPSSLGTSEPPPDRYRTSPARRRMAGASPPAARPPAGGKLSLDELWQRARRLGSPGAAESADIVRHDRDALDRR
ncbi:MAG TPA: hypothetical protein VGI14_17785 [Casimicrobiaceae bacterium]